MRTRRGQYRAHGGGKIFALRDRKKEPIASLVEREKDEPLLETLSFEEIEGLLE